MTDLVLGCVIPASGIASPAREMLTLPVIDPGPGLPRTLEEALAVIRAMHHAVVYLRHPEVTEMIVDGREAEFDALVRRVLDHSAPVTADGSR